MAWARACWAARSVWAGLAQAVGGDSVHLDLMRVRGARDGPRSRTCLLCSDLLAACLPVQLLTFKRMGVSGGGGHRAVTAASGPPHRLWPPRHRGQRDWLCIPRSLDLTGPLLLGGVPNLPEAFPVRNRQFVGCMRNLSVDGRNVDMASFIANNGTRAGTAWAAAQGTATSTAQAVTSGAEPVCP